MGTGVVRRVIAVLVGGLMLVAAPVASGHDTLPDLSMARLTDMQVTKFSDGRTVLKFSTTIVNVGQGAFELHGARTSPSAMSSVQRIFDSSGTFRDVVTPGSLVFGGDGHNHWHVLDLASAQLIPDNDNKVGTSTKRGFCFWDNVSFRLTLPGAPRNAFYDKSGCGTSESSAVAMGLSVGWGDEYASTLPDQNIDISAINPGRYRLQVSADTQNWFAETNELNNETYVDLQIRKQGQPKVLGYGPTA